MGVNIEVLKCTMRSPSSAPRKPFAVLTPLSPVNRDSTALLSQSPMPFHVTGWPLGVGVIAFTLHRYCLLAIILMVLPFSLLAQEITGYRTINVTLDTQAPAQLALNRGRVSWVDIDPGAGKYNLKYYSGAEIVKLDSGLLGLAAVIDGDHIAWNVSTEQVRLYNLRSWNSSAIGPSYYGGSSSQIALAGGRLAYARHAGGGTEIVLRKLDTGTDTVFRAGLWNTEPRVNHGQLAWVSADLEISSTPSTIMYYDGFGTRNLSNAPGIRCRGPVLRDGQVAWLELSGATIKVKVFTGDSVMTLTQALNGPARISGYDLSDGVAVAGVTDTVTNTSTISVFNGGDGSVKTIVESKRVSSVHIDNGLIVWQSGLGGAKRLKTYQVQTGIIEDVAAGENPVVDDEVTAWTNGDAVEMRVPVTYRRLTIGSVSGWAQTRFKSVDNAAALWGDFTSSVNARVNVWNGTSTILLTDSSLSKDFFMANDGVMIWREDSHTIWLKKGPAAPTKVLDSLQCENMYVAGGTIGFHGFRLSEPKPVNQAWLYKINSGALTQLTADTSLSIINGITLVNGDTVCWYRSTPTESMLMLDVGGNRKRLSDSLVGFAFSYRNGRIVWSEQRAGTMQIMTYVPASGVKTQITSGSNDCLGPVTDGTRVVWFEGPDQSQVMVYYDLSSDQKANVARVRKPVFRWLWMSNGRIAWSQDNEIRVYDGNVISRLTSTGDFTPNTEPYVDNEWVMWKQDGSDPNVFPRYGDIFLGKLHAHVAFDAVNISGRAPLVASFVNRSWQGAQTFVWEFGDGGTSASPNPVHIYQNPGAYTVTLTTTGLNGSAVEKKTRLVRVSSSTAVLTARSAAPEKFALNRNYPNPFNPTTMISFDVPTSSVVSLKIYDVLGREAATLVDRVTGPGEYTVQFDASGLASGIYLGRMLALPTGGGQPPYVAMLKMNLIR